MELQNYDIDNLDRQILALLMEDSSQAFTKIAKSLHVSPGTIHVRMKKMTDLGIVDRPQLRVDYTKLGYDITAFLGIYLQKSSLYNQVSKDLGQIPEVVGCHYTTGVYSMFVKIVCRDTKHLKEVLHEKIQDIQGIQRTETFISLEEGINRPLQILENS